ncbi:hypothetical protein D3C78_857320 [compost metagenome]
MITVIASEAKAVILRSRLSSEIDVISRPTEISAGMRNQYGDRTDSCFSLLILESKRRIRF